MKKATMLLIMDGFGLAPEGPGNAIKAAKTPNLDRLWDGYPHTQLYASGRAVGLPDGQMGNSEVGHTNMGAGRVVWQELSKISNEIENGEFFENPVLSALMDDLAKEQEEFKAVKGDISDGRARALHLMGLLSDGGVHSHNTHLYALLEMAKRKGIKNVYVHCILDGRDVPPSCAEKYIEELQQKCSEIGTGEIATIAGRFYSMDRDKRWDRIETAYRLYTEAHGRSAENAGELMAKARDNKETDEFVVPGIVAHCKECSCKLPYCQKKDHTIQDGDSVIFFNFRPDRAREITRCFVDPGFDGFERKVVLKDLKYVCFTQYDATIPNVEVAFPPQSLKNTLGEYVSSLGKKQLRIAETEKYAHVTFFFNGGIEEPYEGEERILVASPKVATYDLQPEMSAYEVTDKVLERIRSGELDLIIMNLANCDMVGHTGVFSAAVAAVEAVDHCVGKIADAIEETGGCLLITADHGNADVMLDEEGNVVTSHSTNPVPLIYVDKDIKGKEVSLHEGALCDLAPTLLQLMELPVPNEMEGKSLID
ncbi:MAG: 2,3-bisphosphoglycerate-independent phosphoglycerate mutase [Firmicutes bacterium]|nr:2,3-bisphosphoglycerate-independent phosphoglycerate mutase [Bacillota bacterium]